MRALTGMLASMLMVAAVHARDPSDSQSLFKPCTGVLTTAEISALREDLSVGLPESAGCLRLRKREFVVFASDGTLKSPFHYCARHRVPICEWEPISARFFHVEREFADANGRRYMLWKTSTRWEGVYEHRYGIASLVPRSVASRGFDVYGLARGTICKGEVPPADPSQETGDEVTEVTGYELLGEATANVELRFTERVVNCETREESLRTKRYRPRNGKFELAP